MTDPVVAQKEPFPVDVEAGKTYAWCSCGLSKTQPFCDGSHKVTDLTPHVFKATESKEVWLCGCKQTKGQPYCDGSHSSL